MRKIFTYCANCGAEKLGDRKTSSAYSHQFCGRMCYQAYYKKIRANDRCRECGRKREESLRGALARGLCMTCYDRLQSFKFNEDLMKISRLLKLTFKEIKETYGN